MGRPHESRRQASVADATRSDPPYPTPSSSESKSSAAVCASPSVAGRSIRPEVRVLERDGTTQAPQRALCDRDQGSADLLRLWPRVTSHSRGGVRNRAACAIQGLEQAHAGAAAEGEGAGAVVRRTRSGSVVQGPEVDDADRFARARSRSALERRWIGDVRIWTRSRQPRQTGPR